MLLININQSGCLKISLRHAVFANWFYLRHLCRACSLLLTLGLLQSCAHTCLPPLGPRKKHGFISFILFFQVQSSNNYACFKFQSPALSDLRPSLAQMRTRGVTRVGTFTECTEFFLWAPLVTILQAGAAPCPGSHCWCCLFGDSITSVHLSSRHFGMNFIFTF